MKLIVRCVAVSAVALFVAACAPMPQQPPPPTISGTAQVGQTLTTTVGGWTGSPTAYKYAWQSCADGGGADCQPVGTNAATYALTEADLGRWIRVRITASNSVGAGYATSTAVGPVLGVPAGTIDQEHVAATPTLYSGVSTCSPANEVSIKKAQTFTAGRSGQLDQVSLWAWSDPGAAPLAITIETVTPEGAPSGNVIGSGTALPGAPTYVRRDLQLSNPAPVQSGESYALVLAEQSCPTPAPNNSWEFHGTYNGDAYTGGTHWAHTGTWFPSVAGADLFFATWVA